MAKLKAVIRNTPSQKNKDETFNVKIRVLHKGEGRDIATDVSVLSTQFENGTIVDHANAHLLNVKIRNALTLYEAKLEELGGKVWDMDARALMNYLRGLDSQERDPSFYSMAERIIQSLYSTNRISYAKSIEQTISHLKAFSGPSLLFVEVTPEYLTRFEISLREKKKAINTIGIHLRNTKMIYNKAIDAGRADLSDYPFRRFKIKKAKKRDRDLEIEDIQKLRDADLTLKAQQRARDLFMLSFYMCGMNFKDLLYAKKVDIKRGRLEIAREKSDELLSIKIVPQAQEIIDRYKGNEFILGLLERKLARARKDRTTILYKDITDQTNRKLGEIAKNLSIPYKLSTYFARHSWSSIAFNECGVSEDIIGLALGHASPRKVTAGYIKKKYELVDQANEAVIASLK